MRIKFENNHFVVESTDKRQVLNIAKELNYLINIYEFASVADLYDICGEDEVRYSHTKQGWSTRIPASCISARINSYDSSFEVWQLSLPVTTYADTNPIGSYGWSKALIDGATKFKPALPKSAKDAKIQKAYNVLTKAFCRYDSDEGDLADAMGEAIRTLGEVLE